MYCFIQNQAVNVLVLKRWIKYNSECSPRTRNKLEQLMFSFIPKNKGH